MTNEKLVIEIKALAKGDICAFERIYNDMKIPVYTIVYRSVYDSNIADDITQEVFFRLYKQIKKEGFIIKPRSWIFQVSRNLIIDHKRKSANREILLEDIGDYSPSKTWDHGLRLDIEVALMRLSETDRSIVTLHINAGTKFKEISEIINKPLGTVLWKYNQSLKILKKILSEV